MQTKSKLADWIARQGFRLFHKLLIQSSKTRQSRSPQKPSVPQRTPHSPR